MKNYVEFHIIHPMAISSLNRNQFGDCKTQNIGGTIRTYVSSQCWKHAIRQNFQEQYANNACRANKKDVVNMVYDAFSMLGENTEDNKAKKVIIHIVNFFFSDKLEDKKTKSVEEDFEQFNKSLTKDNVIIFVSREEIYRLTEFCCKNETYTIDDLKKVSTNAIKEDDLALFGRMLASNKELNVDGCVDFAISYSVNEHISVEDFFTANRDFKQEDEQGATHMGNRECCSPILYRYIGIDLNKFKQNKNNSVNKDSLAEYIKTIIFTTPKSLKHSMATHTPPAYIRMNYFDEVYYPTQVFFEKAINGEKNGKGIIEQAIDHIETTLKNNIEEKGFKEPTKTIKNNVNEMTNFIKEIDL